MTEHWLVTGGCGFLGSNLTATLLRDGLDVTVVDTLTRSGSATNSDWLREIADRAGRGSFEHVPLDIRDADAVDRLIGRLGGRLTVVAHLAGQVAMTTSLKEPRSDFEVNVAGTLNVLEAMRRHAPHAVLLFSSTNKVYGDLESIDYVETTTRWTTPAWPDGFDESLKLDFRTPYGCSKGAADQYVLDYHRSYGLRSVVFRHSSMYGSRQFATYDQGWVSWFASQLLINRERQKIGEPAYRLSISGDGKQVRDLLHVSDAVACYRLAAQSEAATGRAYNIGGGITNSLSLIELISVLDEALGTTTVFERREPRPSDQRVFVAWTRRAKLDFGWEPHVTFKEGLAELVSWLGTATRSRLQ